MKQEPRPEAFHLAPLLEPFVPLLMRQGRELREESETNKKFYLGTKEYVYLVTLAGHVPEIEEGV